VVKWLFKHLNLFALCPLLAVPTASTYADNLPDNFDQLPDDVQAVLLDFLEPPPADVWGSNGEVSGTHTMVRYLDDFHTLVKIDFERGLIRVETRGAEEPLLQLRQAIVGTLLTPADPREIDLYTATDFGLTGRPFWAGQVKDQEGQVIEYPWRAQRYADYLLTRSLVKTRDGYLIEIPMVSQHKQVSANLYRPFVDAAAQRYRISPALILAVIETESSFNPFAVSPARAYGLMQVMQKTAGRDVMAKIHGKDHAPSRQYLLDPKNNIETGTAYLSILRDSYLAGIKGDRKREYCMIAAYNGGAGQLLRTFHRDRNKALAQINSMSEDKLYRYLTTRHPKEETRRYLEKVIVRKQKYGE